MCCCACVEEECLCLWFRFSEKEKICKMQKTELSTVTVTIVRKQNPQTTSLDTVLGKPSNTFAIVELCTRTTIMIVLLITMKSMSSPACAEGAGLRGCLRGFRVARTHTDR